MDEIARRARPDKPALVAGEVTLSFGRLLERVAAAADWLKARDGFGQTNVPRIGLACANGVDYIVLALAILKAGGCLVPLAEELTEREREEVVDRTGLQGLILGKGESWRSGETQDFENETGAGWIFLGKCELPNEAEFSKLDPAFVRFSSGTTGRSKGVVLSHRKLLERIVAANEALRIGPEDRVLWMLPMAHHFAVSIVLYLYHGACTILQESHLAADVLEEAEKTRATVIYGSPFHHALLAADEGDFAWRDLRMAVSTAAPLPLSTAENFRARFRKPLIQGLGIIEIGLPILNVAGESPLSVGRALPGFALEIRDEYGRRVSGEIGELWIKGPGMFDAYLSPWQAVEDVCVDGFFATGDLAEIDETGLVFLRGRKKSVLNVSGMKVFPEEIEAVLNTHGAVERSRVMGLEHAVFGMVPVAEVILHDGKTATKRELIDQCRAALSAFKVPVRIQFVESLPLTASGKIRRV